MENQIPTEIPLSRDNVNAIIKAFFMAKYKLKPGERTFDFNWKQFEHEVVVTLKR